MSSPSHAAHEQSYTPTPSAKGTTIEAQPAGHSPSICPTDRDSVTPHRQDVRAKIDKQSTEYIIKSGIAGGLAGCAAKTVVGPLDRVKILFQTSNPQFAKYTGSWLGVVGAMKNIYKSSGSKGLFRGHSATLLRIFPYAGIKFLAYEQVRAVFIHDRSQETPLRRFSSGAIAGSLSVFFTYPLEVIRVRLAFETTKEVRSGVRTICRQIYNEHVPPPSSAPQLSKDASVVGSAATAASHTVQQIAPRSGLANFYRGFTPTMWGMLPYAGSSFLTHDSARDWLRHHSVARWTTLPGTGSERKPAQLTAWAQLFAGGLAGFVSQTTSYPLEVIRRRMQVGGVSGDGHRLGMAEVARVVYSEKGWRGFWVGLTIGYVKVVPMVATSFYVYERSKFYLGI